MGRRGLLSHLQRVLPGLKAESPMGFLSGAQAGVEPLGSWMSRGGLWMDRGGLATPGSSCSSAADSQELDEAPPKVGPRTHHVFKAVSEQKMAFPSLREEEKGIGTPTYGILINYLEY